VFRDGSIQIVEFPTIVRFVAGTPNGWLMQEPTTYRIYYYQYGEGGLSYTELDAMAGLVTMLQAPALGVGVTEAIIPVIP
jgi:hypothetical protein